MKKYKALIVIVNIEIQNIFLVIFLRDTLPGHARTDPHQQRRHTKISLLSQTDGIAFAKVECYYI